MNYIIVQAGGKGTRMGALTANKPKALVPINNLPMIFHLFRKFPDKRFIVIGDYKYDVLKKYLDTFSNVDCTMICASLNHGTCSGLRAALSHIPDGEPFLLIWCDLVLPDEYELPKADKNYIGISKDFHCRWKYQNGEFHEECSSEFGVAGFFIFTEKALIADVPYEGEFVRWLKQKGISFAEEPLHSTREYGLKSEWDKLAVNKCRPFNRIETDEYRISKIPLDAEGEALALREAAWYKKAHSAGFKSIPAVYGYHPLCMERIGGKNVYEYEELSLDRKRVILKSIVDLLKSLHSIESRSADKASYYEAYIDKTFARLERIRELVPFANDETVLVNGRRCRNVFYWRKELETAVMRYCPNVFKFIHGDCTFSNIMLRNDTEPVLIDPRGYFGNTEFFGDAAYDWVKLYYSLFSNYDKFNLKRFELKISDTEAELIIESNKWEPLERDFFELVGDEIDKKQMKLLLSIIWLSLTTYVWNDFDSICGAFYNGLHYLEEAFYEIGI